MDKSDIRAQLDGLLSPRSGNEIADTLNTVLWRTVTEQSGPQTAGKFFESSPDSGSSGADFGKIMEGLTGEVAVLGKALVDVKDASVQQTSTIEQNTTALAEGSAARLREAARAVSSVIGAGSGWLNLMGGLGAAASGISKLISRNNTDPEPELPLYSQPASIRTEAALPSEERNGLLSVSYGQDGFARATPRPATIVPQVTVQVQAMDSRSFLDHSNEIARAVRDAVLNMHSLNDVMAEL